jgi:dCTP deaminase
MKNDYVGTLADADIISYCSKGKLIAKEFEKDNIKQACYELRAGNIYYDLSENCQKNEIQSGNYILLKPKQMIVLITLELLDIPTNILGRILTKGKLFSIGLLPVNTYADPGFYGQLGIVLYNLSNNYVKIYPGESIAKIEFTKLHSPVSNPYRGQHGYQTKIWPLATEMILTDEEIRNDPRISAPADEIIHAYGQDFTNAIRRVYKFERYLILTALIYFLLSMVLVYAFVKTDWITPMVAIILGVGSNILTSLLIYFATSLRRR